MTRKLLIIGNNLADAELFAEIYSKGYEKVVGQETKHLKYQRKFVGDDFEIIYSTIKSKALDGFRVDAFILTDTLLTHGRMNNILIAQEIGRASTIGVKRKG